MIRQSLIAAVLVVLVTGCGGHRQATPTTTVAPSNSPFAIASPTTAPAFLLRDQDGRLVGPQLYRGRPAVVTFLYTHCPDVCPLIADQLGAALRRDPDMRVIAVSVDPARDTPAAIKRFLRAHRTGPAFHYVTGTHRALDAVWRSYHVAALPGPSGTVSHSSFSILLDRRGRERFLFDAGITAGELLRTVRANGG